MRLRILAVASALALIASCSPSAPSGGATATPDSAKAAPSTAPAHAALVRECGKSGKDAAVCACVADRIAPTLTPAQSVVFNKPDGTWTAEDSVAVGALRDKFDSEIAACEAQLTSAPQQAPEGGSVETTAPVTTTTPSP